MPIDVVEAREQDRKRRLSKVALVLTIVAGWLWWRLVSGNPVELGWPSLPQDAVFWLPGLVFLAILGMIFIVPMLGNGRSPHTIYLPEQIEVGFDDVRGLGSVVVEVSHTLEVFLNHKRFRSEMGGNPRRGVLFEGPPGTGKTHIAKAMAKEAGVPFLFVSSTAFQSMWYGATARKIRSYFRQLRKVARREGGAIGFIEEIDAIGIKRGGLSAGATATGAGSGLSISRNAIASGTGGVVNELLIQMQSFDEPTRATRARNVVIRFVNRFLPPGRSFRTQRPPFANILLIGATNRAADLDPALLRPGRFDRILHFDLPGRRDRRELIDYFLTSKAYDETLDGEDARNALAAGTIGYTPAALERLFDEALLMAMRANRTKLSAADVRVAQMEVEIGLPTRTDYEPEERATIATHEAGHATVAYIVAGGRKLEVLSIIKRRDSLGLLAHREIDERFTKRSTELKSLLQISMGGIAAEEIFFGESGSGPAGDLAGATGLAAEMVGSFGLGGSLVSFRAADDGIIGSNLVARVLDDGPARKALEQLLDDAKSEAKRRLIDNRHIVVALRDALLEREELVEDEIMDVIRGAVERHENEQTRIIIDLREKQDRLLERMKQIKILDRVED